MSIADDLQKLGELRRSESLTDAEFAQAKAKLLVGAGAGRGEEVGQHLSQQLTEIRYQNELSRIDREWEIEREKYYVASRYGRRQLPTTGMAIAIAAVGGTFGLFWTILTISIAGSFPNDGAFGVARMMFPLFGIIFIVGAIGFGAYCYFRAIEYEKALATYQSRRRAIRSDQSP